MPGEELFPKPDSIQTKKGGEIQHVPGSKDDMDQPWYRRDEGIRNGEFTPSARIRRITDRGKATLSQPAKLSPGEPKPLGHPLRPEFLAKLRKRG